jgi:hypothetical protein
VGYHFPIDKEGSRNVAVRIGNEDTKDGKIRASISGAATNRKILFDYNIACGSVWV